MKLSAQTQSLIKASLENLPTEEVPTVVNEPVDLHDHVLDQIEEELHVAHGHVEAAAELLQSEATVPDQVQVEADAQATIQEHVKALNELLPEGVDAGAGAPVLQASLEALAEAETQGAFRKGWEAFKRFLKHLLDKVAGFFGKLFGGVERLKAQCAKLKDELKTISGEPKKPEVNVAKNYLLGVENFNELATVVKNGATFVNNTVGITASVLSSLDSSGNYELPSQMTGNAWPYGYRMAEEKVTKHDIAMTLIVYRKSGENKKQPLTVKTPSVSEIEAVLESCLKLLDAAGTSGKDIENKIKETFEKWHKEDGGNGKIQDPSAGSLVMSNAMSTISALQRMGFVVANAALKTCANAIHAYHGAA